MNVQGSLHRRHKLRLIWVKTDRSFHFTCYQTTKLFSWPSGPSSLSSSPVQHVCCRSYSNTRRLGPLINGSSRELGWVLTFSCSWRQKLLITRSSVVSLNNGRHVGNTRSDIQVQKPNQTSVRVDRRGRAKAYCFICNMISFSFTILKVDGWPKKHSLRELIYHNERKL